MSGALHLLVVLLVLNLIGCSGGPASDLRIERLPQVDPSVPAVPTIPPPPHPVTYPDSSYSLFGLRRRSGETIDHDVELTGYIVEIYAPPECPRGETCRPAAAPHIWLADTAGETDRTKRIRVTGYAMSHQELEEARGARNPVAEDGETPIPTDFAVGNRIKVSGRFSSISQMGFNDSAGLIDYRGHSTLQAAAQ